jgi:hypothetical protein
LRWFDVIKSGMDTDVLKHGSAIALRQGT